LCASQNQQNYNQQKFKTMMKKVAKNPITWQVMFLIAAVFCAAIEGLL
jgi:hypothetical protein